MRILDNRVAFQYYPSQDFIVLIVLIGPSNMFLSLDLTLKMQDERLMSGSFEIAVTVMNKVGREKC